MRALLSWKGRSRERERTFQRHARALVWRAVVAVQAERVAVSERLEFLADRADDGKLHVLADEADGERRARLPRERERGGAADGAGQVRETWGVQRERERERKPLSREDDDDDLW